MTSHPDWFACITVALRTLCGKVEYAAARTMLLLFMGLLVTSPVQAEFVKIVGTGATNCTEFLTALNQDPRIEREYFAWAQGYMSGILIGRPPGADDHLDLKPMEFPVRAQMSFLREYCANHRQSSFSDAVEALYHHLRGVLM